MDASVELRAVSAILAMLKSIDGTLRELLALSKTKKGLTAPIADATDLDSTYGDEIVKFMPRDWAGHDFKGARMSECPVELLDMLADTYAYFAQKNDASQAKADNGTLKSTYDRRSEGRARGWAARKRAGWKPPATGAGFPSDAVADEDMSF